jgi:hypothetical protein
VSILSRVTDSHNLLVHLNIAILPGPLCSCLSLSVPVNVHVPVHVVCLDDWSVSASREVVVNFTHVDRRTDSHTLVDSITRYDRRPSSYLLFLYKVLQPNRNCNTRGLPYLAVVQTRIQLVELFTFYFFPFFLKKIGNGHLNAVYARHVNPSSLDFSLSSHRH